MTEFKTFAEWNGLGYVVIQGAEATHYRVSPDGLHRVAVFSREQVVKPAADWVLLAKEDLPPKPGAGTKGKRVRYSYKNGKLLVWVGSHADAIKLMKKAGFRFAPKAGRWHRDASRAQVEAFIKQFKDKKYAVIDEDASF